MSMGTLPQVGEPSTSDRERSSVPKRDTGSAYSLCRVGLAPGALCLRMNRISIPFAVVMVCSGCAQAGSPSVSEVSPTTLTTFGAASLRRWDLTGAAAPEPVATVA